MNEANMPVLVLYALLYPVVLAGLLHLALKSNRFERRHLLIGTASIGFLFGVGGNLAFIQLLSGFDQGQL
jgi:hypothetical protein